jgi:predicted N-acetyltransferase YhbS
MTGKMRSPNAITDFRENPNLIPLAPCPSPVRLPCGSPAPEINAQLIAEYLFSAILAVELAHGCRSIALTRRPFGKHCSFDCGQIRPSSPEISVSVDFTIEPALPAEEFQAILIGSTLGERRPVQDLARLDTTLRRADLIVTARDAGKLVGISRAITDFSFCCYLSDLAVDVQYQRRGIGKQLIDETHLAAGLQTTLILVAAPVAESYYPKIGMKHLPSCWAIPRRG